MAATIDDRVAELERANAQLRQQLDARSAELKETREQQTATAEVLQVINSSPGDLAPVFDAMLDRALRLCNAAYGNLLSYDGDRLHPVAVRGDPRLTDWLPRHGSFRPGPGTTNFRIIRGEVVVHVADAIDDEPYRQGDPIRRALVEIGQCRALLSVALRKDDALLGVIHVYRTEPHPFSEKQIALLQNFAAQAVIAIENARLITETREALEQQTATAEVLGVINSSPGELAPVFDAILEKAHTLCGAAHGSLTLNEGEHCRAVATRGMPEEFARVLRQPFHPGFLGERLSSGEPFVQIADITATPTDSSAHRAAVGPGRVRTLLAVPLWKDGALLGYITANRQEVRPFSDKQISLLQNFAAQAVIAMENARLLTETREALEQQTATAEVLQVINSSPGDLAPVFASILDKAHSLCDVAHGSLQLYDGVSLRAVATHGVSDAFADILRHGYRAADSPASRGLIEGRRFVQIADCAEIDHPVFQSAAELAGIRTVLFVPLRRDDALLGLISSARREVRPFSDKEIALLQNFAAQAVIAMENARLLTETREALEQQTATAEVLQVINSSPGDLAPVWDALLERATRLCEAASGILWIYNGNHFSVGALHGVSAAAADRLGNEAGPRSSRSLAAIARGESVARDDDFTARQRPNWAFDTAGMRTGFIVAMRKGNELLGAIRIFRREARPFTDKQIALVQNFAAQAVIAMENARLLTETREALEQQTATAEVLQVINSSPGELAPVFDAILEKAHTLCSVAHGSLQLYENGTFRAVTTRGLPEPFDALVRRPREPGAVGARLLAGDRFLQLVDQADGVAQSASLDALSITNAQRAAGLRTVLYVALRKDTDLLGFIGAGRNEVRPFTDKEVALLENFAAQAVIAMENARLLTETREALELQTATAEVLQVINSSPGDLAPVFDAMLEKAHSLCGVARGSLELYDGKNFRAAATHGLADSFAEQLRQGYPASANPATRPLIEGQPFTHILDRTQHEFPFARSALDTGPTGTLLCVPLRRDDKLLGMIAAARQEVRPFSNKQIALLQNFAAQAVIAMENARLITETREALEQQTATAEVLQVINSSPGDLAPVFDAILQKASSLCGAAHGSLQLYDGEKFRAVADRGIAESFAKILRQGYRADANDHVVQIADLAEAARAAPDDPMLRAAVEVAGHRTVLMVPLLKDGAFLGRIVAGRQEVRPFTDKEIALLQNFAAQAVIAMENARLLTETREALEQQTATAEVLQVINSSPGELAPVFDAILDKGLHLCEAAFGTLWTFDGECFHAVALRRVPAGFAEVLTRTPYRPEAGSAHERLLRGAPYAQIDDAAAAASIGPVRRALVEHGGARTVIAVPLLKDGTVLGAISAFRQEVRSFSDKQIALLQNFAAQAVIAMENARLLTETREALELQTATAEVLQVINSSPGDLAPVFDAMLEKAHSLCGVARGSLELYDGKNFRAAATHGLADSFAEQLRQGYPASANPATRPLIEGQPFTHILDRTQHEFPFARSALDTGPAGTLLCVPLRRDERLLGMIASARQEVRPFSDKQIALLQNFAAQAVIAMENARLITETREALEQQTATAEVLQVINSSPGDLAPVFDAILQKASSLCGVAYGSLELYDGVNFRAVATLGFSEAFANLLAKGYLGAEGADTRALIEGARYSHILDQAEIDSPVNQSAVELDNHRTLLCIPLRRDGQLMGMIASARKEVRAFSEKEIALLENFAAQAVIAMENARLITETREALEQQTATAEVLQVINSSPGELAPVFEAILEKAHSFCGAVHGSLHIADADGFRGVAMRGVPEAFVDFIKHPFQPGPNHPVRELIGGAPFATVINSPEFDDPIIQSAYKLAGMRTGLFVPLRKDRVLRGYIVAARPEIRPFTDKQIALLQNFAAQAVIAMENARLITETREALEQQTATAEVLQVINSSPGDLTPVVDAMLERAVRLCGAVQGVLWFIDGERLKLAGTHRIAPAFIEVLRKMESGELPAPPQLRRLMAGERIVHIDDVAELDIYRAGSPLARAAVETGLVRTLIWVALVKEGTTVGAFAIARREVRPFSEKQIALLQNFAAQAVIAMENARLLTETREALAQQTATAEVLQVINSSPGDLAPVFDAMLDKAVRLCDFAFAALWTYDGTAFHPVALHGMPAAFEAYLREHTPPAFKLLHDSVGPIHFPDVMATEMPQRDPEFARVTQQLATVRTLLLVPLRKDAGLLGAFVAYRQEVRPFSDKQISLLQNFAAQAVIAMENARLLTETREALEQQTATAEVLQVINSSPGDLAPVFDAMLEKAMRLCEVDIGALWTYDGEMVQAAAVRGAPLQLTEFLRQGPRRPSAPQRWLMSGERVVQITDITTTRAYRDGDPLPRALADVGGVRTFLAVPLRKDDTILGNFAIYRQTPRPFSEKQIALLQNFAAQAVIAMENARLLNELRQRTRDLQESLEYQTATSDVLKVISQSTFDLGPVLENVIETALRLCRAHMGSIFRLEDGVYRWAVGRGLEPAYQEIEMRTPILAGPGTLVGLAALEGRAVQIADAMADPLYAVKDEASLARARTMLGVPLLREGASIGVIAMARDRVEPFSEREVALVTTFADQAVIAIENARLFDELRERTAELGRSVEELKMLGEVGRAVSSTLDLRAVLSTILTASLGMTWATAGAIFRYIRAERAFRLVEAVGWDEALLGSVGDLSIAETETLMSEAALRRTPIQLSDLAELPSTPLRDASLAAGLRSVLIVPLVGPERIFGALVLQRREAGEFPAEMVRLMQTLASQSVLAIQNARLFREIADKSEQLALASQHKSQFLANMSHELRTPLNAILGYAELLVDGIYGVLPEKAQGVLERVQNNGKHLLALINDVLDLAKIEAGQLTLTLEDYALAEVVRSVVTATEPLAATKGLKFTAIVQDGMPVAHGDARRVSQVLLNLVGNAIKFTDQGEVAIDASAVNGQFVLEVRDTGPGIADADQERIFGEFQQIDNSDTRKKGGTGLGLAISKRMVEMQGGLISVDSMLGAGSTFRVVLPVHVEPALEEAA